MIFFSLPSQKLAFMVSLGLVTHDHLEGRKNVLVGCSAPNFMVILNWK